MGNFPGFPEGKTRLTPLPGLFFRELIPDIDHLGELKVVLFAFWLLDHLEGSFRYLIEDDYRHDAAFMAGLSPDASQTESALQDALQRAVQRSVLLRAVIPSSEGEQRLYFLNSPRGRAAIQAIQRGEWRSSGNPRRPVDIWDEVPNIFRLYEENIGPLTPMLAEALRDAETTYPLRWIEEGIRKAVENNIRNWRYVEAILKRWQREGRDERKDRPDTEKDRRRYIEGEFADFIEH